MVPLAFAGITAEQKGAILDNYKKRQYDLLFESKLWDFSSEYADIVNISKKVWVFSNISEKISSEKSIAEQKTHELQEKIQSLEESIEQLDSDIEWTRVKVDTINRNVVTVKWEIESNKKQLEIISKKITENREILLEYLAYLYKKQQNAYGEEEFDNIKSILLSGEDIGEVINDLYFTGIIQVTGKKLIDKHRKFVAELYKNKNDLERKEVVLKKLRKNAIVQNKILRDKKAFKEEILKKSKGKQSIYKNYIKSKIEAEKFIKIRQLKERIKFQSIQKNILEKYGCDYVDVSKNTSESRALSEKCYDINKMIYNESRVSKIWIDENKNFLSWPVKPEYGISSYFRDPDYTDQFWSLHDALDIPVVQGTDVRSSADWYVLRVEPADSKDYAYVAIKHSNGYVTIYGHISEALVDQFDYVYAGQIIAKSGWEFGTNGAGFLTTGPHLHFELYKDQEYVDPLFELNIANLKYDDLPSKYKEKFLFDFQTEKGYEYLKKSDNSKTFRLDGDSEVERQKSLIHKYAVWWFRDWNIWIEESLDGNIDPTLTMCIALAETGIGKNLKTPYNVWNVGNNDRGDTRGYPNARSGVYSIIQTLNNRYFRGISDLSYLSWAGRAKLDHPGCRIQWEFCYATDVNHWHKNVIKCMTAIKGRYVSDRYNFRIQK